MKKLLLILLAVMVLGAAGGAAWWKFGRRPDHMGIAKQAMQTGDLRLAALELRNAVRDDPSDMDAHYRLGYTLLQLGDAVAAQKELESTQSLGGKQSDLPVLLAQSYLLQGNNKQLLEKFTPPLTTADLTAQLLLIRALALATQGDQPAALEALATAEKSSPRSASVPLTAARIAMSQGDLILAQEKIDRALAIDPRRVDAMLLKAQVAVARGNRQSALETLNNAVSIAPRFVAARLERANIELDLGQDDRTRQDLDEITKQQPNSAAAVYLNAVLLTRAHRAAQADLEFQKLSTVMDRFPRANFFLAVVKLELGQVQQALDYANRYYTRHPADIDGVKLLATAQVASKRPDQAIETLQKALRLGLSDSETLNLLSQAYIAAGKPGEAVRSLDSALAVAPQRLAGKGLLGQAVLGGPSDPRELPGGIKMTLDSKDPDRLATMAALRAGDLDGAAKALEQMRIQQGATEEIGLINAMVLVMRQEYDGARLQYQRLMEANPTSIRPRIAMAQLDEIQGRTNDAEAALNQILAQNPANEPALNVILPLLTGTQRTQRAVTVLEAAVEAAPENRKIGLTLAALYVDANQAAKALKLLDQLVPKGGAPTTPELLVRAHALEADRQVDMAMEAYRQILIKQPGEPQAIGEMMALQQSRRDLDGARDTALAALKFSPDDMQLMRLLIGNEYFRGGEAAANLQIAKLESDPATAAYAPILRADLAMVLRKFPIAAELYVEQIKQHPTTDLVVNAASAYGASQQPTRAAEVMDEWLKSNPNDARVLHMASDLKIATGKNDEAISMLERLNESEPDNPVTMNNLAWMYATKKDPRALALARRAFVLQPTAPNADTLGWILVQSKQAAAAVPLLSQAVAVLKGDPTVQFHYATALAQSGKRLEAMTIVRPLAEQETAFPEQEDARKLVRELRDN